jgi:hypothetical protein
MILKLRGEADGQGGGFDVTVDALTSKFQLARPDATDAPYDVSEADVVKLVELHKTLLAVAKEIAPSRKRLVAATLDDAPIWEQHEPRQVVERLVAVMAPIAQEIAAHSPSATELVLKRLLADDRREEVFVSKAMLVAKLDTVPERLRAVVAPIVAALATTNVRSSQPSYPR